MEPGIEKLIAELPDREAARRFLDALGEKHPAKYEKLKKTPGLLSDVATLAAFSPLLATTLLQNPDYLWWLNRKRTQSGVRGKEDLLESLARFSLTNSQLEPQVLFARFRRRELLRIYLRDIRRLATIAEITEEISNLADAILESALKLARREMDNRFGTPQETDDKGRLRPARFCIAALGKLGSRELNYSSDIDLLFLYSNEGNTFGGVRVTPSGVPPPAKESPKGDTLTTITNREYFVKLAQYVIKLVGSHGGEGGAYRVDLRLRPHGTLGSLALSVNDTIRYCKTDARAWERQVLIRSRGCAGDTSLFKSFFARVEDLVFSKNESVEAALENVRRSKEKIDLENVNRRGFNVKLGSGGIREIEFLAQALQLAHGGRDKWLRSPHTLISLSRLADRGHIAKSELTDLSTAYEFLRRTEHVLQMENGLQTHTIPDDPEKRVMLAQRVTFATGGVFERDLCSNTQNVTQVFARVFGLEPGAAATGFLDSGPGEKSESENPVATAAGSDLASISPHFAAMIAANPRFAEEIPKQGDAFTERDYDSAVLAAIEASGDFGGRLSALRRVWMGFLLEIVVHDIYENITIREAKRLQTALAEASLAAALDIAGDELAVRVSPSGDLDAGEEMPEGTTLALAVLALGKLGGRGLDYGSDLDLMVVYDESQPVPPGVTHAEYYSRAVELFVTALSAMTRDGHLYRVDLRLRPYGSKGLTAISGDAFLKYMAETAAVWEMLAFVKLRAVGGPAELGAKMENETRRIIHRRAVAIDAAELAAETRRVRLALEKQRTLRRGAGVDIKYGPGGMLDVYFAMRFLQLRDNTPDDGHDRSTTFMLDCLKSGGSLSPQTHADLSAGYAFLSELDHHLRLTVGRTTGVPLGNQNALTTIAGRMKLGSSADLIEQLTMHRLSIRAAFEDVLA